MFFVSLRADLLHEVDVRDLLISVSLQLSYKLSDINLREFGVASTSYSFDDLFEDIRNDLTITLLITLFQNGKENVFLIILINLFVK